MESSNKFDYQNQFSPAETNSNDFSFGGQRLFMSPQ